MVRWLVTCATEAGEKTLLVGLKYKHQTPPKSYKDVTFFCV